MFFFITADGRNYVTPDRVNIRGVLAAGRLFPVKSSFISVVVFLAFSCQPAEIAR